MITHNAVPSTLTICLICKEKVTFRDGKYQHLPERVTGWEQNMEKSETPDKIAINDGDLLWCEKHNSPMDMSRTSFGNYECEHLWGVRELGTCTIKRVVKHETMSEMKRRLERELPEGFDIDLNALTNVITITRP